MKQPLPPLPPVVLSSLAEMVTMAVVRLPWTAPVAVGRWEESCGYLADVVAKGLRAGKQIARIS